MADDAPPVRPTRADAVRFGVFVLLMAAGGVWVLLSGLQRDRSGGVPLVVLGGAILLCVAGLGTAVALVRWRDRRLPPAERAAAREARHAEARERRPAWLDNRGFRALMAVVSAYWLYLLVTGVIAGAWRQVVVSGLFLVLAVSTEVQARRRRATPDR